MARTATAPYEPSIPPPSPERLVAWPTVSHAAELIGKHPSVLGRAMEAEGVPKHPFGRRDTKIAPVSVLHFARVYGANVEKVAYALVTEAAESDAERQYAESVEEDVAAWMKGRALAATPNPDAPSAEALLRAVRELAAPELVDAVLERARATD